MFIRCELLAVLLVPPRVRETGGYRGLAKPSARIRTRQLSRPEKWLHGRQRAAPTSLFRPAPVGTIHGYTGRRHPLLYLEALPGFSAAILYSGRFPRWCRAAPATKISSRDKSICCEIPKREKLM